MIQQATFRDTADIIAVIGLAIRTCIDEPADIQDGIIASCADSVLWWRRYPDSSVHYVYRIDGNIVGTILVKEYWNLSNLFVDPRFHHQGIARQLITKALEVCKERSPKQAVHLNASEYAVNFYQKLGFVPNGEPKDLPGGCFPFIYMFNQTP
ncbi:GNAT family N-acetyltransferase [Photobacterium sp. DNB23_23_1]|uniref:GNAT family N-acetyltransferase n=1 Tax=Photobacterium pectinilyticum TaxID=2906793 RepID=A0ABT1N1R8_9GAMM|nr:GNAT family N-acetyltransferase [Photobacterium sp. ZSDE20]MCQ1058680.1 GNAT family N-acetyltransferase [Photobacterium sp. ZSDE20]MDD1823394.1 GNAT family N-acetyltransferase [Photobacterium sp. ZSDE20]